MAKQLKLPTIEAASREQITEFVRELVQQILLRAEDKSKDTICYTMKMPRDVHGQLLSAAARHGITMTDLLLFQIDQVLPALLLAEPVRGHKKDLRTVPKRRR